MIVDAFYGWRVTLDFLLSFSLFLLVRHFVFLHKIKSMASLFFCVCLRRRIGIAALFGTVFLGVVRVFGVATRLSARLADAWPPARRFCAVGAVPGKVPRQVGHAGGAGAHEAGPDGGLTGEPASRVVHQRRRHQRKGKKPGTSRHHDRK